MSVPAQSVHGNPTTVVTQSPRNAGKSSFSASYSRGEPTHLALASNLVCSDVMAEKESPNSANEGAGSISELPQKKTGYSVWVCPWRPSERFSLHWAGSGAWLAAWNLKFRCRQTGSQLVIPLGLI